MKFDELSKLNSEFAAFYQQIYGDRWPALLNALLEEEARVDRFNEFCKDEPTDGLRAANGLLLHYAMDPASIEAARALDVQQGEAVLDMCAAPGGKSLILAEGLSESGHLITNEISDGRRDRLKKVLRQYLPENVRDRLKVTGKDGGVFAKTHARVFDRILVDAPCSGERHLLANQSEFKKWSPNHGKRLVTRQYALLTGALITGRVGATIVYSTCSISPAENDGVINRLFERKAGLFEVLPIEPALPGYEKTEHGVQYLPDRCGAGPLYIAKLKVL